MSQIFDYIFRKDKKIQEIEIESVTTALDIGKHEFVKETDMCETGIVRDLFIGAINSGVIIFGNGITYKMIHESEIRAKFFKEFSDAYVAFCAC